MKPPSILSIPVAASGRLPTPTAERVAVVLACSAPVFALTVRGWVSGLLIAAALASLIALLHPSRTGATRATMSGWLALMLFGLVAPLLAALATGLLRGDFRWDQLDAPARLLLAVPLLLLFQRARWDPYPMLRLAIPAAVLATLAHMLVYGTPARWPAHRLATELADPLVFGYVCIAFGTLCLMMVGGNPADRRPAAVGLLVFAAGVAFYLSIRSGSRTGWAAVPIVLGCWIYWRMRPRGRTAAILAACTPLVLMVLAYWTVGPVQSRVDEAIVELRRYSWSGVTREDTSFGLRITYLRMAAELFIQHPLAGIGDTSRMAPSDYASFSYATREAAASAYQSAFHNQIVSNAVRMGLPGLLATTALLVAPVCIAIRGLRSRHLRSRRVAELAFAFGVTMLVSSFSTEIVDLKFMSSFYAVMTAMFIGAVLSASEDDESRLSQLAQPDGRRDMPAPG